MEDFLNDYQKMNSKQKIVAEIMFYCFLANQTSNKSNIRILKSRGSTVKGDKVQRYEIEVPVDD